MSRRDTSRRKMEARIEEAEGYLKILRARASLAGARMQEEFEERKEELNSFIRAARRRLEGRGRRMAEAGEELREDLEHRWEALRGVVDAFLARTGRQDTEDRSGPHQANSPERASGSNEMEGSKDP